jgi:prevent-host-death family protein
MVTYGHDKTMRRAKVSELKARLSAYLADVRAGNEVLVCDRATPIARLVPVTDRNDDLQIIPASAPPSTLTTIAGVRPRGRVDVDALLAELRRDR